MSIDYDYIKDKCVEIIKEVQKTKDVEGAIDKMRKIKYSNNKYLSKRDAVKFFIKFYTYSVDYDIKLYANNINEFERLQEINYHKAKDYLNEKINYPKITEKCRKILKKVNTTKDVEGAIKEITEIEYLINEYISVKDAVKIFVKHANYTVESCTDEKKRERLLKKYIKEAKDYCKEWYYTKKL